MVVALRNIESVLPELSGNCHLTIQLTILSLKVLRYIFVVVQLCGLKKILDFVFPLKFLNGQDLKFFFLN